MKYVVDLGGFGRQFMGVIRAAGIGYREPRDERDLYERQKYLYNESASQISTILTADHLTYLKELQKLPNPVYFEHFDDFNNPQLANIYINAFKELALGIWMQVGAKIGLNDQYDYLLEAVAEDYMVICVIPKPVPQTQGFMNVVPL